MDFRIPRIRPFVVIGMLVVVAPASVQAELTRVEIVSRVDVLDGKAFGEVGPYEKIHGKAYFAVDPANPRNQVIADIALAPRNKAGKGGVLLRPLHPQAERPCARQRCGLLRCREPRAVPPAERVQRRRGRGRPHQGSRLR